MTITDGTPAHFDHKADQISEALIQRCSQIATLPAAAVQIIRLIEDPDLTIDSLTKIISQDPAIAVRVIKLANSSYYGVPGKINTIKLAVVLLGLRSVKNIAVAASLVKLFRGGHVSSAFDVSDLWIHSITVATSAMMLARRTEGISPDEAFLGGLIHDVGILVEIQTCRTSFARMVQKLSADKQLSFRIAEEEEFGTSHESIGAAFCKASGLPESLQLVTGYHHRPWKLDIEAPSLPALIHIADVLAARSGLGYTRTVEAESVSPELLRSLMLSEHDLESVTITLPEAARELHSALCD